MAQGGIQRLVIKAYKKFLKGELQSLISSYELQLNPTSLTCTFAKDDQRIEEPRSSVGSSIDSKRPTHYKESVKFSFILDNTGAIPSVADGVAFDSAGRTGLKATIDKLKKVTIVPLRETHAPPFVHVIWGDLSLQGVVNDFSIEYTYFNAAGNPLRARVNLGVVEVIDSVVESAKYQSPDITRMPVVRDGQSLPQLCMEFYDDPHYYLQIAKENNLASFRRLKPGMTLRFPPLEK